MKTVLVGICLLLSCAANAQFTRVQIGVNGLTCSQCSRNVEMSLRQLDFISKVDMNLEHTEGDIYLEKNKKVDIARIAKAVRDAGFSLRYLNAHFVFDHLSINPGKCFSYDGASYEFINVQPQILDGEKTIKFLGDKFQSRQQAHEVRAQLKNTCSAAQSAVYYITI